MMTLKDISMKINNGELKLHHAAWAWGYISRKISGEEIIAEPYKGRFGEGYKAHVPSFTSTRFHIILYYIEQ